MPSGTRSLGLSHAQAAHERRIGRRMSLTDLHRKPGHLIWRLQQIAVALFVRETGQLTPRSIRKAAVGRRLGRAKGPQCRDASS